MVIPQKDPVMVTSWVYDAIQIVSVQYTTTHNLSKQLLGYLGRVSQFLGGEVAEVIVYDRVLSEDIEKLRVTNYLTQKYGVAALSNVDNSNYDLAYPANQLFLGFEVNQTFPLTHPVVDLVGNFHLLW